MKSKIAVLLFLGCFHISAGFSQANVLIEMLEGFNKLASGVSGLGSLYKSIDDASNKGKVKDLVGEISKDLGDLIIVKQSIVSKLKDTLVKKQKYHNEINRLQGSLSNLTTTLLKGEKLFQAAGINSQDLVFSLKQDYYTKVSTLERMKIFLGDHNLSDAYTKTILITYFTSCINVLSNSQKEIKAYMAGE